LDVCTLYSATPSIPSQNYITYHQLCVNYCTVRYLYLALLKSAIAYPAYELNLAFCPIIPERIAPIPHSFTGQRGKSG
jgi:hypothetical protein